MSLIDLVNTPRKKALLCLIYYGNISYNYSSHSNWGYHTLPDSFSKTMPQDVFQELMEQLTLDGLVRQFQRPSDRGLLIMWGTTNSGKRIVKKLLGDPLPVFVRTVRSVNESNFLAEKFGLSNINLFSQTSVTSAAGT